MTSDPRRESFFSDAKFILQNQDKMAVDHFYKLHQANLDKGNFRFDETDNRYVPASKLKEKKAALEHWRKLRELTREWPEGKQRFVEREILAIELELDLNEVLNTGGKASNLRLDDLWDLYVLKADFSYAFPHLASNYNRDSLLHQLGESLTGRNLPDKIITKVNIVLPFMRKIGRHIERLHEIDSPLSKLAYALVDFEHATSLGDDDRYKAAIYLHTYADKLMKD